MDNVAAFCANYTVSNRVPLKFQSTSLVTLINYLKFNANKSKVLHIGNNNPRFDNEMTDKNYNKVNIKKM